MEKTRELANIMERRKLDILCVQETKLKESKDYGLGEGSSCFLHRVGVILKEEFD